MKSLPPGVFVSGTSGCKLIHYLRRIHHISVPVLTRGTKQAWSRPLELGPLMFILICFMYKKRSKLAEAVRQGASCQPRHS